MEFLLIIGFIVLFGFTLYIDYNHHREIQRLRNRVQALEVHIQDDIQNGITQLNAAASDGPKLLLG